MKTSPILFALGSFFFSTASFAEEGAFSCSNMDNTISAEFSSSERGPELTVKWPTLDPTMFSGESLFVTSGESLWSEIPGNEFTKWPYGVVIAKDKAQDLTVIISIVRPASAGGGGYSYEGTFSISAGKNDPVVSALYCR